MLDISKNAPDSNTVTDYDRANISTYLRLYDADQEGAGWQEAASLIFGNAAETDPLQLKQQHASHLARAKWLVDSGHIRLAQFDRIHR